MVNKRRSVVDSIPSSRCYIDYDYDPYTSEEQLSTCQRYRCCLITVTSILLLLVLIFIVIFVVLPVIFMLSSDVRQYLVFQSSQGNEHRDFTNFKMYGIEGVRNLYVFNDNTSLGVWHVLPLEYTYPAVADDQFDYDHIITFSKYPILLYFHDTGENRIANKNKYLVLRRFFHVIAFDYRGFGDSTQGPLSEEVLVNDAVRMYKWLRGLTSRPIYFWGHALGSALAAGTARQLRWEFMVPTGLVLESPFTNLAEEVLSYPWAGFFSWLPWFKGTVLDPLKNSGLLFNTDEYILSVDCPIMILHAKDDEYVPYTFSQKLVEISNEMRGDRGNVTLHLFSSYLKYGHNDLYQAPELPDYLLEHIGIGRHYNMGRN